MRKSRFLLNLIAVTAVGLSVLGCESSDSGVISDASDINNGSNQEIIDQRRNLHEYMIVGVRGLEQFTPDFSDAQSAPVTDPPFPGKVVAQPGDGTPTTRANLYELTGIADTPQPNATLTGPGGGETPTSPVVGTVAPVGTTGYHEVVASPRGDFAILISRAHNRNLPGTNDPIDEAQLQIFALDYAAPLDVVFPPSIEFGAVADPTPIRSFSAPQGEFVSGAWSSNAEQFYASVGGTIVVFAVDGTIGRIDETQVVALPNAPAVAGSPGVNNAAKLLASADGKFIYAMDNGNSQILTYARNPANGFLSQVAITATVADPRGMTIDRSASFLYVSGRSSNQLAGYKLGADGGLTPIELIAGLGPAPLNLATPLGDVDANPQFDQLFVASYAGLLQSYTIDTQTGALTANGQPAIPLGKSRNTANIEVEPTGRFVITANEHDYDTYQPFLLNGTQVFANLNPTTNGADNPDDPNPIITQATPSTDKLGRIVYVNPFSDEKTFTGDTQVFRIQNDGTPRVQSSVPLVNPFGLTFFQKVIAPPAGAPAGGPVAPPPVVPGDIQP